MRASKRQRLYTALISDLMEREAPLDRFRLFDGPDPVAVVIVVHGRHKTKQVLDTLAPVFESWENDPTVLDITRAWDTDP